MLSKKQLALVIIVLLHLVYLPLIYVSPFHTKGEPREALVAQEMIANDNYILPERLDGQFATKPPMTHWWMVLASQIEGELSEGSARLPSLVLSLITILILFSILKPIYGSQLALTCCLILLCSAEWHRAYTTSRVDMTFASFLIMAQLLFFIAQQKQNKKVFLLSSLCLALATLAKGPAALALFGASIFLYQILMRQKLSKSLLLTIAITISAVAISSLWYLAAYNIGGEKFMAIVMDENFKRFTGKMAATEDPHSHSAFYLYATVFLGFLPLSLILLGKTKIAFGWIKENFKVIPAHSKKIYELDSFSKLALASSLVALVLFSIPESKRSVYLLPIYPYLAFFLMKLLQKISINNGISILVKVLKILLIATPLLILTSKLIVEDPSKQQKFIASLILLDYRSALWLLFVGLLIIALPQIFKQKTLNLKGKFEQHAGLLNFQILQVILFFVLINYLYLLPIDRLLSAKEFCQSIREKIQTVGHWHYHQTDPYSINFYLNVNGTKLDLKDVSKNQPELLITTEQQAIALKNNSRKISLNLLSEAKNYYLKPNSKLGLYEIMRLH